MNITTLINLTNGKLITKTKTEEIDIEFAMASDLMSDVLTLDTVNTMLITGLANLQTIRTAEMSDVHCILLARNKKSTPETTFVSLRTLSWTRGGIASGFKDWARFTMAISSMNSPTI